MTWPSFNLQIELQIDTIASTIPFMCCMYGDLSAEPEERKQLWCLTDLSVKSAGWPKKLQVLKYSATSTSGCSIALIRCRASEYQSCGSVKSACSDHSHYHITFIFMVLVLFVLGGRAVKSGQVYLYSSRVVVFLEKVLHTWNALCIVEAIGLFTLSDLVLEQNRRGRMGWCSIDVML